MQAYSAICLWSYCKHIGVQHNYINKLIQHLLSILTIRNLADWEQNGTQLELSGRGDFLPDELYKIIPIELTVKFRTLVDHCVEVGLTDMYAACSDEPKSLLNFCIDMLRNSHIEIPPIGKLSQYKIEDCGGWGGVIKESDLNEILEFYGIQFDSYQTHFEN